MAWISKRCFAGDGVVTGLAKVHGRRVALYAQDFTVMGGSFSAIQAQKINRVQDIALATGILVIGLNDSGGAYSGRCWQSGRLRWKHLPQRARFWRGAANLCNSRAMRRWCGIFSCLD